MLRELWFRRLLGLCPLFVAVLWVAGIAHFRDYTFEAREWAVLLAAAFALHVLSNRLRQPRPLPPLPAGTTPPRIAALAAAILAVLAACVGGLLEYLVEPHGPGGAPWALRTTWHAACVFAAGYCTILLRLRTATSQRPRR